MSIVVNNLTKEYGQQKAVDNLSFTIDKNEIVGFLGPNGAGKSTTLKIATGYLSSTAGSIKINGLDVDSDILKIKKTIGYLPEHNPLYHDMFVHEFLRYSGRFYNLKGKRLKERITEVINMCQLTVEQNKKIGQLSKGYRQRVGLAQALLHDPDVLILDEPTTGLDPNQLVEVRDLIKKVSKNKTVIFSTHIMQEVQAICDRAIIINKGKKVADQSIQDLLNQTSGQVLEVEFERQVDLEIFKQLPQAHRLTELNELSVQFDFEATEDMRPVLMKFIAEHSLPLIGIKKRESSMEDVFNALTKSA